MCEIKDQATIYSCFVFFFPKACIKNRIFLYFGILIVRALMAVEALI